MIGDPHYDYTTAAEALDDLNEALRELSTRSESIVFGQYHAAQKDQGEYPLGTDFLQVKFVGFKAKDGKFYDLTRGSVKGGTIVNENRQRGYSPYYEPATYDIGGRASTEKVISQVAIVHSQTYFTIANPPSTLKVGDRVINATNSNAQGTITVINSTGIEVDEWKGQTQPSIEVGDTLRILSSNRLTDRGTITVEKVLASTRLQVSALPTGLTAGDVVIDTDKNDVETKLIASIDTTDDPLQIYLQPWGGIKVGDVIRIESPSRENHTLIISPPPAFTDTAGSESIYVHSAHSHRVITQSNMDIGNDTLDIDAELVSALTFLTASYMATAQHDVTAPEVSMFDAKYEREFHKNMPSVNSRIAEYKSIWFSNPYMHIQEKLRDDRSQTANSGNMVNR